MTRRRVAVVGSGVAGLTAAYVLQKQADVTLFEAAGRLGGHAHTHDVLGVDGRLLAVDSGFIVHNERTYPFLRRLFDELGVQTQPSEMSMSVRCAGCGLEYAGARGVAGLFAAPSSLVRGRYLRLLAEVPRFHRRARRLLADGAAGDHVSLQAFLAEGGYSRYFVGHFVTPLVSAVWSCAPQTSREYPARYLFEFLANHGMLSVSGSPQWRTVVGGSRSYVDRVAKELSAVVVSTPIRELSRSASGVLLRDDSDTVLSYDAAVVATHADEALGLLADASAAQREVLGAFRYSDNATVLHTDASVLPRRRGAAASWNYVLDACDTAADRVSVSYDMNRLQRLDAPGRYVVTLNDPGRIPDSAVLARMRYTHPIYTPAAVAAQRRLPSLNDSRLAFAGAYHGWGFHEDGCRSGVQAAAALGVSW